MKETEILILNLEEVRRRSIILWRSIPDDKLNWKPDEKAMSCIEMVRHVVESDNNYGLMLDKGRSLASGEGINNQTSYISIEAELETAQTYRQFLLQIVRSIQPGELTTKKVDRSNVGYTRSTGDFILRIAYHESIHAGQMLSYLRQMNVPRPNIWD